jgi:hypothetical protein
MTQALHLKIRQSVFCVHKAKRDVHDSPAAAMTGDG